MVIVEGRRLRFLGQLIRVPPQIKTKAPPIPNIRTPTTYGPLLDFTVDRKFHHDYHASSTPIISFVIANGGKLG